MSSPRRTTKLLLVVAGLAAAVGIGLLAAFLFSGSGDRSRSSHGRASRVMPQGNLRVLTAGESRRLVSYAGALRSCLAGRIPVAELATYPRMITVVATRSVGTKRLVTLVLGCASGLGGPPARSSVQVVDERTTVLSLPKRCLLDPKVEASHRLSQRGPARGDRQSTAAA